MSATACTTITGPSTMAGISGSGWTSWNGTGAGGWFNWRRGRKTCCPMSDEYYRYTVLFVRGSNLALFSNLLDSCHRIWSLIRYNWRNAVNRQQQVAWRILVRPLLFSYLPSKTGISGFGRHKTTNTSFSHRSAILCLPRTPTFLASTGSPILRQLTLIFLL